MEKTTILHEADIKKMPRLYRNNMINSLSGFKSANLLGTVDSNGNTNLAVFSSVTHFGSNPALLGFVTRPHVVPRHTYENIKTIGYYTVNHIHKEFTLASHKSSAKYVKEVDEFEKCGFSHHFGLLHPAPYVAEAKVKIGLQFEAEYPIKENGTILVLGKIIEVITDTHLVQDDGFVDLERAGSVTINGLDAYLAPKKIARYSYARPDQEIMKM
ncbi:MAG: flavin reductase [Bacteroidota bacterium]